MAEFPEINEYSAMSSIDIAHAIINWADGSEDQIRAISELRNRAPDRHHNRPPLEEELDEEVTRWQERQHRIIEVAGQARILDDDGAQKVVDLSVQVRALRDEIKQACDARLRPYLDACDLIHRRYDPMLRTLTAAYGDRTGGLRGMINAYVQKREAAAAAERERLAAEQRRREEEAAAARRAAEEQKAAGEAAVGAELTALKAEDLAERAQQRADAVRPGLPIRSHLGQVGITRSIAHDITDLRATLEWMIDQPLRGVLEAEVRKMIGAYLRQLGVAAVERGVTIPGIKAWIERTAGVRR